eukprot:TRINITY_DN34914_c0_g1_i1.p1 TRINITY_DN34914_c0_g1~~TRINITY_DN34914_c0_g1_i1.p1  ORF type:complete len:424 (-),score=95.80 TRINITY_DN34914_c0_g1_i1:254-1525(-)
MASRPGSRLSRGGASETADERPPAIGSADDGTAPAAAAKERLPLSVRLARLAEESVKISQDLGQRRNIIGEVQHRRKAQAEEMQSSIESTFLLPWGDYSLDACADILPTAPGSRVASGSGRSSRQRQGCGVDSSIAEAQAEMYGERRGEGKKRKELPIEMVVEAKVQEVWSGSAWMGPGLRQAAVMLNRRIATKAALEAAAAARQREKQAEPSSRKGARSPLPKAPPSRQTSVMAPAAPLGRQLSAAEQAQVLQTLSHRATVVACEGCSMAADDESPQRLVSPGAASLAAANSAPLSPRRTNSRLSAAERPVSVLTCRTETPVRGEAAGCSSPLPESLAAGWSAEPYANRPLSSLSGRLSARPSHRLRARPPCGPMSARCRELEKEVRRNARAVEQCRRDIDSVVLKRNQAAQQAWFALALET